MLHKVPREMLTGTSLTAADFYWLFAGRKRPDPVNFPVPGGGY